MINKNGKIYNIFKIFKYIVKIKMEDMKYVIKLKYKIF